MATRQSVFLSEDELGTILAALSVYNATQRDALKHYQGRALEAQTQRIEEAGKLHDRLCSYVYPPDAARVRSDREDFHSDG